MPNPVGLIDPVNGADIDIFIIKNRREEFLNVRFHGVLRSRRSQQLIGFEPISDRDSVHLRRGYFADE